MDFTRHFATDIIADKTGALEVKTAYFTGATSATNQVGVAAVTGKRIRGLGLVATVGGATPSAQTLVLLDGSGGSVKLVVNIPNNTTADPNVILPLDPIGWVETSTGVGLYFNVGTGTGNAQCAIRYVEVTP